ncbi:ZZ-type zinc finger-containing protein 3 [Neocloeon triangulifer]|uniref:ZZ-type zinc finger-containing protein 3 n=1 Tax=Neocloeon triangulifer TaxID=2078957 RepID=UPI00286F3DFD|nr:ZZ-type zinc finger-containing protein 3 [Neocloeon triangulifer]
MAEIEHSDEDGAEEFYFESDYLPIKGNKDYRRLLRTILTLQVQREQAIKDIDKLHEAQKRALESPIEFVNKIAKGEDVGIPPELKLEELPEIDWSQYQEYMPESNRPFTRKLKEEVTQSPNLDSKSEDGSAMRVRGKVFNDEKPETFNQLWTPAEQKRLEELLEEFPPEDIESRRWEKIARALGNRTPMQVQSRVQKYFKKLHSMGLPVPGRLPRARSNFMKKPHKHQRLNHFYMKPSTFFPELDPPVLMTDDDLNSMNDSSQGYADSNSADEVPTSCSTSNQADLLAMVIKDKEVGYKGEHDGFSCDGCSESPIKGTRWHCEDCAQEHRSFDLCTDCLTAQLMGELKVMATSLHKEHHKIIPIRKGPPIAAASSSTWDPDYLTPSSSYNYLDPNFMPD